MVRRGAVLRWFWGFLVVVAAQVVVLPNSLAYEETRTEYGARLRLTSLPARVRLDKPVPGLSDGGQAALLRAIASWNAKARSAPVLVMTNDDDALIEVNAISEGWKFGSTIAAHTAVDSDSWQGDIRHVIIEIDARRKWSQGATVSPDELDLESVLLHELGHALGLDHSRNQEAVMRAGIRPGQTRRILEADDIAGLGDLTKRAMYRDVPSPGNVVRLSWNSQGLFWFSFFGVLSVLVILRAVLERTVRCVSTHRVR